MRALAALRGPALLRGGGAERAGASQGFIGEFFGWEELEASPRASPQRPHEGPPASGRHHEDGAPRALPSAQQERGAPRR